MILNKNYFENVLSKISEEIPEAEVKRLNEENFEIKTKKETYEISLDKKKKIIIISNSEKTFSSWMFDEEKLSSKDIKMIISDFKEIITSKPKVKNKKRNPNESNVTGLFFANRMANIFPDIKDKILREKESLSEFKAVKFTEENIFPKINNLLNTSKSGDPEIKKLGKLISELYSNGTLDVRSIITMCILNNVQNQDCLKPNLSDELKKAWECSLKYKGKKVKPEKPKIKKQSFMAKMVSYQNQIEDNK